MFAPNLRRAVIQSSHSSFLPPTFLLPLRASLSTMPTTTPKPPPTDPLKPPLKSKSTIPRPQPPPSKSLPHEPTPSEKSLALLPFLAAQPPHYITAHIHARPYLLTAGDILRLPFHMPNVSLGTILRLNRASSLGSRDYTFRGQPWIDERLFVCRARVIGVEGEPMRVVLKTKRRQRHVKRVTSKMRYTILRCLEVRVLGEGGGEV